MCRRDYQLNRKNITTKEACSYSWNRLCYEMHFFNLRLKTFILYVMSNGTSPHILNTSANLLGFCLFVITAFHISNRSQRTLIDEFTCVVAILLAASCLFSFASIRSKIDKRGTRLENTAEVLFLLSLIGILVIILFITLHFIK